jgi:hypothetical protein
MFEKCKAKKRTIFMKKIFLAVGGMLMFGALSNRAMAQLDNKGYWWTFWVCSGITYRHTLNSDHALKVYEYSEQF